jgi:adenine-specific DNA methylase
MPHTKLLIEQWLPIAPIGAECMREKSMGKNTFAPTVRLHVWWARRPLMVSRAAVLAGLLPAYPDGNDQSVQPWPDKFRRKFPTFDAYKQWFIKLIGIQGDPVKGLKLTQWANDQGIKLKVHPYGYPRAFTINPSQDQLDELYDLLEWTWGTRDIAFCDPMAGGGSIPFEALRYGLTVHANELNPVASVILKATLDYPARFGSSLVADIRKYGDLWTKKVLNRLEPFFPLADPTENIFCYIWARTVPCPLTGKPVPLSPNWWLRKGAEPMAIRVIADPKADRCRFEIVRGKAACAKISPDKGTIKKGNGVTPWAANEAIDGDYIKAQAKAGNMKDQLVAVGIKRQGSFTFRAPTAADAAAIAKAEAEVKKRWPEWEAKGLIPTEPRREGRADWACEIYGMTRWCDTYTNRQLLSMITLVECLREVAEQAEKEIGLERANAVRTYLGIAIDKASDYNSKQIRWHTSRDVIVNCFARHDLSMRWSFAEFDASRNLATWVASQVQDSVGGIGKYLVVCHFLIFG